MNKILVQFLSKSFSKLAPNATVTTSMIAHVIQTAAMTHDFIENTTRKEGNKPNADIIFKRIKQSNEDVLKQSFVFLLGFMITQVKHKFNRRAWTIAIDTHYEPFYGEHKDRWIHGYKSVKGCSGSYCFITISVVIGNARFTLLALPVRRGDYKEELVEELIREAKKNFRIKLVLLDRGFYAGNIVDRLDKARVKYRGFAPQTKKNKAFLEATPEFSHRYVRHELPLRTFKTTGTIPVKLLIIKDFLDMTNWKLYDWIFVTNLTHTEALTYIRLYKQRWGIETSYRMFGTVRILTTSIHPLVRYFFFLVAVLLYNLWKFYNLLSKTKVSFKTFVYYLFLSCLDIDHADVCRERMKHLFSKLSFA